MVESNHYTCRDCMLQRSGECFGDTKTCADFKFAPTISKEVMQNWPTMGDASAIRMKGKALAKFEQRHK